MTDLQTAVLNKRWTPRAAFGDSSALADDLFTCGDGTYLMTNPDVAEGDPVYAVGWAQSDYWATRVWTVPFRGELSPPPPQWAPASSLSFLGIPADLSFGSVLVFERTRPAARRATLVDASYRITDGSFLSCQINGSKGITYYYASNKPKTRDEPIALKVRLIEPA